MPAATEPDQVEHSDSRLACYVYGIVPSDVELTSDMFGVGDPPAPVQVVRYGDIAALVSEIPVDRPLGTPEDLLAHEQVLDTTAAAAPVLPIRFGAAMTDCDSISEELLAAHEDEFRDALRELEGHAQYVIKGRYVEEAILREVLSENEQASSLSQAIRGTSEDQTRDQRIRLGELIGNAIAAKREQDTQLVVETIQPYCASISVRDPSHEQDAAHVAVLMETSRRKDLESAMTDLQRDWDGRVTLRLLGPMAPFDFVVTKSA